MSRRLLRRNADGSRVPNLQTLTGDSGIANLSPYLTINGSTVAPTALYHGNDAEASAFSAQWGEALVLAGSGTSPDFNQPSYGNGPSDGLVKFNNGESYVASNGTFCDIATEDFVMCLIYRHHYTSGTERLLGKAVTAGWNFYIDGSTQLKFGVGDGSTTVNNFLGSLTPGATYHSMVFGDRSGNLQMFSNGVSVDADNISAVGSLSNAGLFSLGGLGGAGSCSAGVLYAAIWNKASMIGADNATVAMSHFQKWSGIYPTKASGTAAPTYSRASSAYATKWNGTSYDLINCSAGLPRVDYVLDDSSTPFKGMLIEPQATNLLTYSEDSTQLTVIDAGDVLGAAAGIAPNNQSTMVSLVADTTDGQHGAAESNAPTLAAVSTTYSRYFIKGGNDHVWLENTTVANTQSWFNLDTGAVGTLGSAATSRISGPFYSDLGEVYRCEITFTGTVAAHTFNWGSSASDNDETFAGDAAAINCYTWGAQVETGSKASSYIYTAGATATRLADDLQYNGDNVTAGQGTIKAEMLVDAHTPAAELSIAALSDGGSTDEMIRSYVDTGTQVPIFNAVDSTVGQWTITGSTDVVDGDIHSVRLPYETNDAKQYVDTALDGTPDTSCTVPTGIDEIDIGQDTASANQLNGRIRNVAIWPWVEENL